MSRNRRIFFALTLSALLLPGLHIRGFAANGPTLTPDARRAADQAALSLTLFLTDALHLTQGQVIKVKECTRQEMQQLATTPTTDAPATTQQVQQAYATTMATILTPEQFRTFDALQHGPTMAATVARVLAAR